MIDHIHPQRDPEPGEDTVHTWTFDKFSEPRTMPAHWDLSELATSPQPGAQGVSEPGMQPEETGSPASSPEQDAVDGPPPEWHRNLFPEPRTYPTLWDLYA